MRMVLAIVIAVCLVSAAAASNRCDVAGVTMWLDGPCPEPREPLSNWKRSNPYSYRADRQSPPQQQDTARDKYDATNREIIESRHDWYKGGTLHDATFADWERATYRNKLATTASWLGYTKWKHAQTTGANLEKMKEQAKKIVAGIDKIASVNRKKSEMVRPVVYFMINAANDIGP